MAGKGPETERRFKLLQLWLFALTVWVFYDAFVLNAF